MGFKKTCPSFIALKPLWTHCSDIKNNKLENMAWLKNLYGHLGSKIFMNENYDFHYIKLYTDYT